MDRRARPYPVLLAFLAVLAGVLIAGAWGTGLGLVLPLSLGAAAWILLRRRGLRPPSGATALAVLAALGALRLHAWQGDRPPGLQAAVPRDEPVVLEARVLRVVRRDRIATAVEAEPLSLAAGEGRRPLPAGRRLTIRVRGWVDLGAGTTWSARGRLLAPFRPPDELGPVWPRPSRGPTLVVSGEADLVRLEGPDLPGPMPADRVRAYLARRFRAALDGRAADFALSVLLGEGGGIDPAVRSALSVLGTSHVLSVSGLHVAAAAALVGLLLVRLLGPLLARRSQAVHLALLHSVASSAAAWGVSALAGNCAPAQRSAAMFTLAAVAAWAGRRQALESVIGLAGLASLLWEPADAFSLSFLLSYGAMLGLAALAGPLESALLPAAWGRDRAADLPRRTRWTRAAARAACASVAATLATTPLTMLAFGSVSVVAPLANLLVVPVTTIVVMPAALLLVVAAPLPPLLGLVGIPVGLLFEAYLSAQEVLARVSPSAAWAAGPVLFPAVLAAATGWTGWLLVRDPPGDRHGVANLRHATLAALAMAALGALAAVALVPAPPSHEPGTLQVVFLDVGKGDAALIRCPGGATALLDTGEARAAQGSRGLLSALRRQGVTSLDTVLLSHADEDHVGGTPALLAELPVGEVAYPCPAGGESPLSGILEDARARSLPTRCLLAGMDALPDCGARTPVLWPPPFRPLHRNAASLVFRLEWAGGRILVTGDLEAEGERELVEDGADLAADLLKLGHHGSAGATTAEFLAKVRPAVTVATGFPSRIRPGTPPATLRRIASARVRHFSTRAQGWLEVSLPPKTGSGPLQIKAERTISPPALDE